MKLSFNLKSLKNIFTKKGAVKEGMYNARRDWKWTLFLFTGLSLLLACFSGYLFFKINKGDLFNVEKSGDDYFEVVNKKNLDETVDRFETKKAKLIELEQRNNVMPDPSI